ncbi:hypothetical protein [Acrocarpospora catenulata]|uniref:hypothetical protein n=1 Tax=Acrocarpospora catenulata TaxID=2836182 RepID=UPI001BD9E69A|nr:hypothetical protein [Acrocarpospora catenulata]
MADPAVKTAKPAKTDTATPGGPVAEAAKAPSGPGGDLLDVGRAAGNQAANQVAAAQQPEPSGVLGFLASAAVNLFIRQLTGSGPQQRIAAAAIRGFVFTLAKEVSAEGVRAGLKELAAPKNMTEFALGYEAGLILGFVSPVTDLFGIVVLAEQMQMMAAQLGRAAWEHPEKLIAEAGALKTDFLNFLTTARTKLTAAELLKHIDEVTAAAEKAAGTAGSRAAHAVVLHFSGKEDEQAMRPGAAPAGPAAQLEHWATETRKKLTSTQWSRLGYNVGYDVGFVVSNTLLFVFSMGAGEAVAAIGAKLGQLGGLLARAGNTVEKLAEGIKAIEALIGALVSKPMKWLEPVMEPFFRLLERLRGFLRELLGFAERGAAKAAVTAVEKGAAKAAAPKPPAAKPTRTAKTEPSVRKRVATEKPKVRVATEEPESAALGAFEPEPAVPLKKRPALTATPPPKAAAMTPPESAPKTPITTPPKPAAATPKPAPSPKKAPKKVRKPEPETHTEDLLIEDAEVLAQPGMSKKKPVDELLQEAAEGRKFENRLASPQRHSQVPIYDKRGRRNRLDYYDDTAGEIISVKSLASANGQIAFVDEFTMLNHFQEFALKYPTGARVVEGKLAGKTVTGRYILEVPPQIYPIPDRIMELARASRVTIRDTTGKVWQ